LGKLALPQIPSLLLLTFSEIAPLFYAQLREAGKDGLLLPHGLKAGSYLPYSQRAMASFHFMRFLPWLVLTALKLVRVFMVHRAT
jgi:hypothetical protein